VEYICEIKYSAFWQETRLQNETVSFSVAFPPIGVMESLGWVMLF
jgi:hypothetical protein